MQESKNVPCAVDVSICILNWNGSKLLEGCLQSLRDIGALNQVRYEIVVVDNGSSDDSVEMVRRQFPEVRLVTIAKNTSISAATNEGLRLGVGRYSLILNNDIVMQKDSLDQMVQFLDKNPRAGIIAGRLLNPDGSTQRNYYPGQLPTFTFVLASLVGLHRVWGQGASGGRAEWDADKACRMEQVPGACMMVRREVFQQIGFWDSDFTCWYEDVDFCRRGLQAGWELWYVPEARVVHYGGATFRELGISQKTIWRFHGLLRYSAKHFSRVQNVIVRFFVVLTFLLRLPRAALLSIWPRAEVRRTWKGSVSTYLRLIVKLPG